MFVCKICKFIGKNKLSLSKHISSKHNIKSIDYYLKYISENKSIPTCQCGCNEDCKLIESIEN